MPTTTIQRRKKNIENLEFRISIEVVVVFFLERRMVRDLVSHKMFMVFSTFLLTRVLG